MAGTAVNRSNASAPVRPRKAAARPSASRRPPASRPATSPTTTAKRQTKQTTATAAREAKRVKTTAATRGRAVARTATSDVQQLAGSARQQAEQVTSELADQARELVSESRLKLQQQVDLEARRLAANLAQVGTQALALAAGQPAQAGPLADYVEQAANWLDACATDLEDRGVEGVVADVADFAGRRPGVFLLGAAALGFGVGRLVRSGALSGNGEVEA